MDAPPSRRTILAATWALFVGVFLLTAGNGLQFTTVGVRSTIEGFDSLAIGVMTAAYYVGFLAGAVFTYRSLGRVGHLRVFAALASTGSASVLLHSLLVSPVSWSLMRVATGFCLAGLFIVIESWINDQATNATRGVLMSAYMVTVLGGRAAGQALLNVGDPGGFDLFVMSSVMVSMALVPMMMSATSTPPVVVPEPMRFAELRSIAPTGVITIFVSGWTTAVLGGLAAVYATRVGMDTGQVSLFVGSLIVGAALFQLPIGSLSDRFRRRLVVLGVSVIAIVLLLALAAAPATGWTPIVLVGLVGGFTYPMYGLGVALTNDWIPDEKRVAASMLLMIVNGVAAIIGPVVASLAMDGDPSRLFVSLAVLHAVFAGFLAVRIAVRAPKPVAAQSRFAPVADRVTAFVLQRRPSGPGTERSEQ
ncbi:MAG: MFS transporter [Actinomycetota bacterium]